MSQPNILVIISDQMIASLAGAYGHPVVKTPAQAMQTKGTSWAHDPGFDPNKNAQSQYLV